MGVEVITEELNRLYEFEMDKYLNECDQLKKIGYRIYRNSDGKHKVVPPVRKSNNGFPMDINNAFGGIFGEIFRNM